MPFEQTDVGDTYLGQMIGDAGTDNTAADDDDLSFIWYHLRYPQEE